MSSLENCDIYCEALDNSAMMTKRIRCDDDETDSVTSMDKESLMVSLEGRHITPRNVLCAAPK